MRGQSFKNVEKEFLEPSFQYLVKNGLENTSVRDLCKAMGISYGSLYYWFDGKDDIYISVVKYGIGKVADNLFRFAFETIDNPKVFFDSFLDEVKKYKMELRLVFQFATSPDYGDIIREKAEDFIKVYEMYIVELGKIIGSTPEKVAPIIYMLISVLVDFVVWEDIRASELQMKFLHEAMNTICKTAEV
ncbi:MAG: TetR/AcrR family transcriptional regulator [Ruminococcaceae bacterium]|nr:TetR/AcrR family transcriptional regulator [Oscillospiraceae bacterium]